ncbi:MAG: NUDIX domain-containing protein [Nitrososphaerota archaeon]|jgi:8-oxo-dGTP pyrophosphatase MutT (NUDIX family)|nr:NUDIX domain-containing protein [Nitrososphaerota archaeon]MDG6927976.1 NUDIX domain-containing protein [Nitrososphaerota archaeon]MDG6929645.1 NUDIX domain-containing protein [Nitrososphaerota archaeon]MDG6932846.1 NUDIX domain-containing protein [Nitrososphaerota archaeon]MDG6936831.1 NUDIX domain-containing protein [Nitrososphaerota archaeon]
MQEAEEHSAGGVLFRLAKGGVPIYLVLMSRRHIWEFPKGHIERGEDSITAAIREVKEETGINQVGVLDGFKYKVRYQFMKERTKVKKDVIYYIMKSDIDSVKLSDEHIGYMWLDYNSAFDTLTHNNAKALLMEANSWLWALEYSWRA